MFDPIPQPRPAAAANTYLNLPKVDEDEDPYVQKLQSTRKQGQIAEEHLAKARRNRIRAMVEQDEAEHVEQAAQEGRRVAAKQEIDALLAALEQAYRRAEEEHLFNRHEHLPGLAANIPRPMKMGTVEVAMPHPTPKFIDRTGYLSDDSTVVEVPSLARNKESRKNGKRHLNEVVAIRRPRRAVNVWGQSCW